METTQNVQTNELDSFGNSQAVSNIADFLSLEELGIGEDKSHPIVDLDEVERPAPTPKEDDITDSTIKIGEESTAETVSTKELGIDLDEENTLPETGVNYKSIVKDLIESGTWDGIEAFETENGSVPFEEMEIDKDTFVALMKHNQEELKSALTSNSISTEGISEFTQKLISIEKHGGNVQQALQAYQTIKQPLDSIDINDVRGQRAVCYLRLQQQGITGDEARDLIESYEIKGVLEDKATAFKDQLDAAFNEWMLNQEEEAIKEDKAYRESLKAYKSSLNEALKNSKEFELSETHRKKLLEIATKEQEDGNFELDTLIDNHRRNPNDAADLILFLTDKDTFIEKKAKQLLEEERKKTLKTISIIPKGKSNIDLTNKTKKDDLLFPLDKLK